MPVHSPPPSPLKFPRGRECCFGLCRLPRDRAVLTQHGHHFCGMSGGRIFCFTFTWQNSELQSCGSVCHPYPKLMKVLGLALAGWGWGHSADQDRPRHCLMELLVLGGGHCYQRLIRVTEHSRGKCCEETGKSSSEGL